MKIIWLIACVVLLALIIGCSRRPSLPDSKLTLRVVDEQGNPVEGAKVGIAFEVLGGNNRKIISSRTLKDGLFTANNKSTGSTAFSVEKEGYYPSWGGYHFDSSSNGKWQPWNPEVKVILRKILNPVSMYARDTQMSKMYLPISEKPVGFDLVEYDWVAPYGHGKYSDFIFKLRRNYINENEYSCSLTITFSNSVDGIQLIENDFAHSNFKLPRYAPDSNYSSMLLKKVSYDPKNGRRSNFNKKANYIFRVRSEVRNSKLLKAMYGKIRPVAVLSG